MYYREEVHIKKCKLWRNLVLSRNKDGAAFAAKQGTLADTDRWDQCFGKSKRVSLHAADIQPWVLLPVIQ